MNTITQFLLTAFYVIIPAAIANMMPVFVRSINFLNTPVDFNKKWFDNKPIFGDHKTYRGFFFGIVAAIIIAYIQSLLYNYPFFQQISFFNYNETSFLLIGFMMGFGVLFGDLVKSFFKRRMSIKSGDSFFPWDQLDLVIGAIVFISIIEIPPWQMVLFYLIAGPLFHVLFNHIGYWLGIREVKW
jgi:CDP-2,3-bis-(O-geranylgeranyl)-sn-glycerol synthase